jgi:small subunit ribosomal protein S16
MLVIRLTRIGAKKQPTYRVVVTEARTPRDSREVERLGYYNPKTQPATLKVNRERVAHWLKSGAQPSATVKSLLKKHKEAAADASAAATVATQ